MLENNLIIIGILSSFFAPWITTALIVKEDGYARLDDDIKYLTHVLFWLQMSQVLVSYYLTFIPHN